MLRIEVSGYTGEGKSQVMALIHEALQKAGKKALVIEDNRVVQRPMSGTIDVVMTERYLSKAGVQTDLDFLVGCTESAAYELAQEHGYTVRIVKRNDYNSIVTRDLKMTRVNLSIVDNTVVAWSIG